MHTALHSQPLTRPTGAGAQRPEQSADTAPERGLAEPPTQPCRKDTLDSKLQRVSHVHPRPSGRRPIHVPIPPNVPPMGTGPAFRTRCEYSSNGSMDV